MQLYQLINVLLIMLFINIADALYEGDSCNHTSKDVSGVCKRLDQCSNALQELKLGIRPQHCGFANVTPIVCCPSEATAITSTTPTTTMPTTTPTSTKSPIGELPIGEKSRLACESYKNLAYKMVNYSSLGSPNELKENCPWDHRSIGVNFNGKVAEEGEFPHMVLLGYGSMPIKYLCGGSLISEKYVLTAAHCLYSSRDGVATNVRLGDLDYADPDDDQHVQEIKIKKRFAHPLYNAPIKYHDIALLELEHPAQLSLYVKPICLYRWDPARKVRSGMVTGWGQNQLQEDNTRLLKGGIQYFTQETCNRIHRVSRLLPSGIDPETQICFGPKGNNSVDTCNGDSGGPIQIYNKDVYCSYYTFGITSFGLSCGHADIPAAYTKLYKYIEWIESIVWP